MVIIISIIFYSTSIYYPIDIMTNNIMYRHSKTLSTRLQLDIYSGYLSSY